MVLLSRPPGALPFHSLNAEEEEAAPELSVGEIYCHWAPCIHVFDGKDGFWRKQTHPLFAYASLWTIDADENHLALAMPAPNEVL